MIDTDGYNFELAADKKNNVHLTYTNTTIFNGNSEEFIGGQIYYGVLNLSSSKIDDIMQIKPSGWYNHQNKIGIDANNNILIVYQNINSNYNLALKYKIIDKDKKIVDEGTWAEEMGVDVEPLSIIFDYPITQNIFSILPFSEDGVWITSWDIFSKKYIDSPFIKITNDSGDEIIDMVYKENYWEGAFNSDNIMEIGAFAADAAGNINHSIIKLERPQSKIVNNEAADRFANLIVRIEKKTADSYVEKITAINKAVKIPANGMIKLDSMFNPLNTSINEAGNYRVYASLSRENTVLQDLSGNPIEASWEFSVK
jgi:hypothetical protein